MVVTSVPLILELCTPCCIYPLAVGYSTEIVYTLLFQERV